MIQDGLEDEENETIQIIYSKDPSRIKELIERVKKRKFVFLFGVFLFFVLFLLGVLKEEWRTMNWEGWVTVSITLISLILLTAEIFPIAYVFLFAVSICYILGIVTSEQALAGFCNTGTLTVGVLLIVAKTIELSDLLKFFVKYILGSPKLLISAQLRLLIPTLFLSAFINTVPLVAMLIPVVTSWCRQCNFLPTHLMLPLSYAAILGGTCTVIGTATNLIILGLVEASFPNLDIGFFEIGIVGFPVAIVSLIFIFLFTRIILKPHQTKAPSPNAPISLKEYVIPVSLKKNSTFIGKTVRASGFMEIKGINLSQIIRAETKGNLGDEEIISSLFEEVIISDNDILFFHGALDKLQVLFDLDGVIPSTNQLEKLGVNRQNRILAEAVISSYSPLVNHTLIESRFRKKYNGVVLGIHRVDTLIDRKLTEVRLLPGDTLYIETFSEFIRLNANNPHFSLVSFTSAGSKLPRKISITMGITLFLTLVMIILSAMQIVDLLPLAMIVTSLFVLIGNISWSQSLAAIPGELLLILAMAFGLGNALQYSGAADVIANSLLELFSLGGRIGVLAGIYIATVSLSAVISNSATATLMFPIAVNMAYYSNISIRCVVMVLMMAASASFTTPFGFQTNLMVYTPGGYTAIDYLKFGLPMTFLNFIITVTLSYYIWVDVNPNDPYS